VDFAIDFEYNAIEEAQTRDRHMVRRLIEKA